MPERRKRTFIRLIASVIIVLGLGMVASLSYVAGRRSAIDGGSTQSPASLQDNSSIEADQGTPEPVTETALPATNTATSETPSHVPTENGGRDEEMSATVTPVVQVTRVPVRLSDEDLGLMIEVWDFIDREFDGPLPEESEVLYSAIQGSLESLDDRFTRFLSPELATSSRERLEGTFEGIGALVDITEDGFLRVVRPLEGQPADLAGIKADDIVIQVDGQDIQGMTLEEIVGLVKGPEGTVVALTIRREEIAEPLEVSIVRDVIEVPIVVSELLDQNIGYLRLTRFSSNAPEQVTAALETLLNYDLQGLILDLRDNPGGFLPETVEIADLFLPSGVVLYQRDAEGNEEVFESDDGDLAEQVPLVVLINEGSASASEIVAGAIKDLQRGTLVGQMSFGKGSVQTSHSLSDGSALRVTIARWYTPANRSIDEQGIMPDVQVDTPEEFGGENDTQLNKAIELLSSGQ